VRRRLLPPRPPDRPRLASLTRVSPKILLSLCHPRLAPSHLPLPADPLLSSKQDDRGYTSVCCVIRSVSSPSQVVVRIHSHSFVERVLWFPSPPPPESPHFFFSSSETSFPHHHLSSPPFFIPPRPPVFFVRSPYLALTTLPRVVSAPQLPPVRCSSWIRSELLTPFRAT